MTPAQRRLRTWEGAAVDAWRVRWRVPRLRVYAALRSTNTLALRLAARGAPPGTTVIADFQSAGRGRRGAPWLAPPGHALLFSTIARAPTFHAGGAGPVSIRVGLIVARAIEAVGGIEAWLKWPNDVLAADGRKLAGILCEGALGPRGFLVVGVGINVRQSGADLGPALRPTATSIADAGGSTDRARPRLAEALLADLAACADVAAPLDPDEQAAIARRDALLGRRLAVDGTPAGTGDGILADGGLRVWTEAGRRIVYSGSVTPEAGIRPASGPPAGASTAQG